MRLRQLFPVEMAEAASPIVALFRATIEEGASNGSLHPTDIERDAELITEMTITAFHRYAVARRGSPADVAEHLASFVLHGLGG